MAWLLLMYIIYYYIHTCKAVMPVQYTAGRAVFLCPCHRFHPVVIF